MRRRVARPAPERPRLLRLNKPMGVLCQFSPDPLHPTLKSLVPVTDVYPAGRLDTDSEGLLLLTNDGRLQAQISDPRHKWRKTYWVQVEGEIDAAALQRLREGVELTDGPTLPAGARGIDAPAGLWPRDPPIRVRERIATSWLELELGEGRNRQVRRMTAAVGFPTLRLIRAAIGPYRVDGLAPGSWDEVEIF